MEPALWPTLADAARVLEARDLRFALIGGLAVSLRGLIAAQRDAIDWSGCLALARKLGAAVDVDLAGRLETARGRIPGEDGMPRG